MAEKSKAKRLSDTASMTSLYSIVYAEDPDIPPDAEGIISSVKRGSVPSTQQVKTSTNRDSASGTVQTKSSDCSSQLETKNRNLSAGKLL